MTILIQKGRVMDPANGRDEIMDVFIAEGKIKRIEKNIQENADVVIDATDLWVTPGFIDLHVHMRDPGYEEKETIQTGTASAAMGGFTSICPMPNTNPVIDNERLVAYVKQKETEEGFVHIYPVGSVTKGEEGQELSQIDAMVQAGIVALSEDGRTVENAKLLKEALALCKKHGIVMMSHCEDKNLKGHGQVNEGNVAQRLGLEGIPPECEDVIVARDIVLAEGCGAKLHICHVSTAGTVQLIRDAKQKGLQVTGEVAPHHFTLTDEDIPSKDANFKMAPPLRSKKDVIAILQGLQDGTLDCIATDHAPHQKVVKDCDFECAANGIVGLETAFSLGITELVEKKILSPQQFIAKLTSNPAKIIGIDRGTLRVGAVADVTITDPNQEYIVAVSEFKSKSKNSPFDGRKVKGKVQYTIVGGTIVVEKGKLKGALK